MIGLGAERDFDGLMMGGGMDFVKEGTYRYEINGHEVVVNVPRTLRLEEVLPACERFARAAHVKRRKEDECKTASA